MREILLFELQGVRYAVRADEVHEAREAGTVIRPPLRPALMAGLTVIEDRTVVLIDLGACLGLPAATRRYPGEVLLPSGGGDLPGFLVESEIRRLSLPAEAYRPLSPIIQFPLLDGFLLLDERPVPIIHLQAILQRLQEGEWNAAPEFRPPLEKAPEISGMHRFRVVTLGGRRFALPASDIRKGSGALPAIPLGGIPPFMAGVAATDTGILPVLRLHPLLDLTEEDEAGPVLIVTDDHSGEFGLRVQADLGDIEGKPAPLPPLVRSAGITHALMGSEGILPLLSPGDLVSGRDREPALPDRYRPAYDPIPLGRQDLQVMEFTLLGNRHAIPRGPEAEVFPIPPWRPIPAASPLVPGVAEHQGEIWPVLDLALYFGRAARLGPDSRAIAVRDGDFKALVLAEDIPCERSIPMETHRELPFAIPHDLVFGCYVEAEAVILVLNVPALAVRFDPSLARLFQEAIPRQELPVPEEKPAGISPTATVNETIAPSPPTAKAQTPAPPETVQAPEPPLPQLPVLPVEDPADIFLPVDFLRSAEEILALPASATPAEDRPADPGSAERISTEAVEEPPLPDASAHAEASFPEPEEMASDRNKASEAFRAEAEPMQEQEKEQEREKALSQAEPEPEFAPPSDVPRNEPDPPVGGEPAPEPAPVQVLMEGPPPAPEEERPVLEPGFPEIPARREEAIPLPSVSHSATGRYRIHVSLGLLAVLLAALGFWVSDFSREEQASVPHDRIHPMEATAPNPVRPLEQSPLPAPEQSAFDPSVSPPPSAALFPPGVYNVRRGDTLWGIAARHTGNPFNFHQIARENAIRNPDRIYPGQRIEIRSE